MSTRTRATRTRIPTQTQAVRNSIHSLTSTSRNPRTMPGSSGSRSEGKALVDASPLAQIAGAGSSSIGSSTLGTKRTLSSVGTAGMSAAAKDALIPSPKKRARAAPVKKANVVPAAGAMAPTSAGASQAIPEKRLARWREKPPKGEMDRLDRVMSQRFFMIDRRRAGDELKEEFSVLGSTGNVYTVVIDRLPRCDCPDAKKGHHCKHIMFVFLKVLHVSQSSNYWYQKGLLSSELQEIFANAPQAPHTTANAHVREAYARATGKVVCVDVDEKKHRMPAEDDNCPICYEPMNNAPESQLVWCEECGNMLHKECFEQWAKSKGSNLTCVFCRARWTAFSVNGLVRISKDGYINLSDVAGVSPVRDTSSYYHGPRRGHWTGLHGSDPYEDDNEQYECT